jgi:hypothetical protein
MATRDVDLSELGEHSEQALGNGGGKLAEEFSRLALEWRQETRHCSKMEQITSHATSAYRRIVEMGEPAVPLILQELERGGGDWFAALRAITKANPVPAEARGKIREIREAWLPEEDEEKEYVLVISQKAGQNGMVVVAADDECPETAFATTIGEHRYLSVSQRDADTDELAYDIAIYEFADNDTLKVYSLDPEIVDKAVADGTLTGIVEWQRRTAEQLAAAIKLEPARPSTHEVKASSDRMNGFYLRATLR